MEVKNLAEVLQYQSIKLELEKKLINWLKLTNDPILDGNSLPKDKKPSR